MKEAEPSEDEGRRKEATKKRLNELEEKRVGIEERISQLHDELARPGGRGLTGFDSL